MPGRVLVAEEDVVFGKSLALRLAKEGLIVSLLPIISSTDDLLNFGMPDVAIIGTCMAGVSAAEICRYLRTTAVMRNLPIFCLIPRGAEADIRQVPITRIDDCAVKPVSTTEVVRRVKRILQRLQSVPGPQRLAVGDLTLDPDSHRVFRQKRELKIGPTEFRLLTYMMRVPGHICSREELKTYLWGANSAVEDRTVDVHVGRLRRAIQLSKRDQLIETVRGEGYVLGNFA